MLLLALALSSLVQTPEDPVRRAVERSLPFLEREGAAWIRERACLSCHHLPFLLWSFREARDRGVAVDEKKLAEWSEWSRKESLAHAVPLTLVAGIGHSWLGHVEWGLLAALLVGSIPGIWLGSQLVQRLPERLVRGLLCASLVTAGLKVIH